jgi:pyrimidine operon attenuation protein/uracil phosphoribosyltransferase
MKELKKDKFKASGNMSPRMNEHKNRRVVHKIVDIQMYRDKNTAEDYDEKFQKINSKVKFFN